MVSSSDAMQGGKVLVSRQACSGVHDIPPTVLRFCSWLYHVATGAFMIVSRPSDCQCLGILLSH
jgi:hypothetical protein